MAEGVRIRIVGDDSEFVKTLEGLEKRAQTAFRGIRAVDGLAGGLRAQRSAVVAAANRLADAAQRAMGDSSGAYNAGAQMAAGFQRGLSGNRSAVEAAARALANAASGAMRSTLQIKSPSRVTMRMGEFAGQGFEIGLRNSLQTAVRSAGRIAGEMNLSPRMSGMAAASAATAESRMAQPIYLNVDGKTLATVITGDMRTALDRRNRSIGLGVGR